MAEVAAHLEAKGTELLNSARRRAGRPIPHTFTFAGFEGGRVKAFVISNFEDRHGNCRPIEARLSTTKCELGQGRGAIVIVTGNPQAVPISERKILRNLARTHAHDGGRIRRKMQKMNADAAARPECQNLVSADCAVASFNSGGYGRLEFSEETGSRPQDIPVVMNGIDMHKFMMEAMKNAGWDMSNAKVDNAVFVSTEKLGPAPAIQTPCRFSVTGSEPGGIYDLHELMDNDFDLLSAGRSQRFWARDRNGTRRATGTVVYEHTVDNERRSAVPA